MKLNDSDFESCSASAPEPDFELEQLRQTLMAHLGTGLFVCDAGRRGFPIHKISPSFTRLTGYEAKEATGQKLSLLYGSMTDASTTRAVNRALSRAQPFRGDLLCYRFDGTTVWCELVLVPVPGTKASPAHFAAALTDISERKQREEPLREQEANCRRIFENATQGIYQSTPEGRYLQVNSALARMYGHRSPDSLMKQVSDIQNQIYVDPSMRERFKRLIDETDQVRGLEYQVRRRDGQIIWISENARVVRDTNGRVRYYEGFIEEITQRKEAEAALQESQQRLIESSRWVTLAEMNNGVLHNVGNALNSVNVSASVVEGKVADSKTVNLARAVELLKKHEADLARFLSNDPKGRQLIEYLGRLGEHLVCEQTELLDELKSLKKSVEHANEIIASQQNYAKSSNRLETINAKDLVEDALRMNANSLVRHRVEVVRDYGLHLPEVTVQKHQVLQILVNLIRNAQKACEASRSTERRLTMRVRCNPGGRDVRIEVQDSGVGIPEENLARLFTHGFTTRKDGHGFGLHSGARIAREMGGSLTAQSEGPGKGARFILEFPCRPATHKNLSKDPGSAQPAKPTA